MTCPTSPREGFWKCRQCHHEQKGGLSHQVGLQAVCAVCYHYTAMEQKGPWLCRKCCKLRDGGIAYYVNVVLIRTCYDCARALQDAPQNLMLEGSTDGIEWHEEPIIDYGQRTLFNPPRYVRAKFANIAKPITFKNAPQTTQDENDQQV